MKIWSLYSGGWDFHHGKSSGFCFKYFFDLRRINKCMQERPYRWREKAGRTHTTMLPSQLPSAVICHQSTNVF